jgi:regulator of protease activity HflC (stomatin/prohibitin superfamily)
MASASHPPTRQRWPLVGQRLAQVITFLLALIALALLSSWATATVQQQVNRLRFGEPLVVRLTTDLGGVAGSTTAWAINAEGQIGLLVAPTSDPGQVIALPGPYMPGRSGRFVVPWLRALDADGDGDGDLVLNLSGELFVYLQGLDGIFHYATEAEQATLLPPDELWP